MDNYFYQKLNVRIRVGFPLFCFIFAFLGNYPVMGQNKVEKSKKESKNLAILSISSQPSGADVFIQSPGKSKKKAGKSPIKVRLKAGSYKVYVEKPGYYSVETVTQVQQNKKNQLNLKVIAIKKAKLELNITPAFAEVKIDGKIVANKKEKELRFDYLKKGQLIIVDRIPGTYEIEVSHKKAIDGPIKKKVTLHKPEEVQTHFFKLKMDPEFIVELDRNKQSEDVKTGYERKLEKYSEELEAYNKVADKELFTWRLKWMGSAVGAALLMYYSYSENQNAVAEQQSMEDAESNMQAANTLREARTYDEKATKHSENVSTHSQNSTQGTVISAVLAGIAYWFWSDKPAVSVGDSPPEKPTKPNNLESSGFSPFMDYRKLGVVYAQRW